MSNVTDLALKRFESFYARLDAAIDNGDVDAVNALVDERAEVVARLVDSYDDARPFPAELKRSLRDREERLLERMDTLYQKLAAALTSQNARSHAVTQYAKRL